jgi:hypothetical protein
MMAALARDGRKELLTGRKSAKPLWQRKRKEFL